MRPSFYLFLTSLLAWTFVSACSNSNGAPESNATAEQDDLVKSVNVEVQRVEPQTFTSYIRVIGTIESSEDILVASENGGLIKDLRVKKGDRVTKNQVIALVDDAQLQREKQRLQAGLDQTKTTYERLKKLYEEQNIGAEIDYLNAKYAFEQAQAALNGVQEQLKKSAIKAPFNGIIEDVLVESGENTAPGTPVFRLIAENGVKITAGVPSRYADVVQVGDNADIWFDTDQPDTLQSVITFVGNSIESFSRTFEIEVAMPNNSPVTKIDMMVNIRLKAQQFNDQLMVSNEFIFDKDGRKVVYVAAENANGETIASEREVKTGLSYNSISIIESGLQANEELITLGAAFLKDQARVRVVNRNGQQLVDFMQSESAEGDNVRN
jgi:RND family efflux transporter MFP subunit